MVVEEAREQQIFNIKNQEKKLMQKINWFPQRVSFVEDFCRDCLYNGVVVMQSV